MSSHHVLGICGSLRSGSFNAALLRAAVEQAPAGMTIEISDALRELPPYDGDLDTPERRPAAVADFRHKVEQADGLLLVTPEYSHSIPGVLKNALDWVSAELPEGLPLRRKPVAITGSSPSAFGSVRAQQTLRQVLFSTHSDVVLRPEVAVFGAYQRFDEQGRLTDETTAGLLHDLLRALAETIDRQRGHHEIAALAGAGAEREAS